MRKVCFVETEKVKKIMMYALAENEVYVFVYDTWIDASCDSDYYFTSIEDAEVFCEDEFDITSEKWIVIDEPQQDCQHDFIRITKPQFDKNGNRLRGQFQSLFEGKWINVYKDGVDSNSSNFSGMTGNERLFLSGLMEEFDRAMTTDKAKAATILKALRIG